MHKLVRYALLAVVLGAGASPLWPDTTQADRYWRNHWRWYDNTYRPYYQRRFYNQGYYYGPRSYYYGPPAYYGPRYYYGNPGYYGGGSVQLGPLQFGWW